MEKNKEQRLDEQNQIPFSPSEYKSLLLYDLLIRLTKASHPGAKHEPPMPLEGLFVLKQNIEANKISAISDILNLPTYPSIKNKKPNEILLGIEQNLNIEIQDEKLIFTCLKCITDLMILKRNFEKTMTEEELIYFIITEDYVKARAYEALGYWAAKVKKFRSHLGQETKQQQEEKKEEHVTRTWLKMINDPKEKAILKTLSQNKIAKRIQERVMPDLKGVKTKTGKYVLTRSRKNDKEGNPILNGLSIRTIITIMQKLDKDKFPFNPFRK